MSNESFDPEAVDVFFGSEETSNTADTLKGALEREGHFTFEDLRSRLFPFGEVLGEKDARDERQKVGAVGLAHVHAGEHTIKLFMDAGNNPKVREMAETYWDRYEEFQTNTFQCLLRILMLAGRRTRFHLEQPTVGFLQDIACQRVIASLDQRLQRGDAGAGRDLKQRLFSGDRNLVNATLIVRDGSLRLAAHCIANGYQSLVHSARPVGVSSIMPELQRQLNVLVQRRGMVMDKELAEYSQTYVAMMDANMRDRHAHVAQSVASDGDCTPVIVYGYSHFRTQPPFSHRQCHFPLEEYLPDCTMAVVMPAGGKELATMGTEADPGAMSPDQLRELLHTIASQSAPPA